jgi:hypothetical protein
MSGFDDALRQAREAEQLEQLKRQEAEDESYRLAASVRQFADLIRSHGVPTTRLQDGTEVWVIEPYNWVGEYNAATRDGEWIQVEYYDEDSYHDISGWRRSTRGPWLNDETLARAAMRLLGEL